MNRVGEAGRGESVWLSWFLAKTLVAFLPYAEARGDRMRCALWRKHLGALRTALDGPGWDGQNYRRGFYDDGTPLGSEDSDECRIDSIAQSWSVLSKQGDPERQGLAMDRVMQKLVDREARIVKLFTPPFEHTSKEPGYIKGYPPGVRENGGQYTHASCWVVYALAELGRGDEAHACFEMLNPITHSRDRNEAETYRVEPYVVAADVYSEGERLGRGGWTWYTGSGGWLYRAAVEAILGIRKRADRLHIVPALPTGWSGYRARLTLSGRAYAIEVRRVSPDAHEVLVDGAVIDGASGYPIASAGTAA
jgi:cyclic beta-1,2-glucan synthetase